MADGALRARARLGRARASSAAGSGPTCTSTFLEDADLHVDHRAHEERALGARRRAARPAEHRCASSCPTARASPSPRRPGCRSRRASTFEVHCGGGGGFGPPSERDPSAVLADVREGYVTEAEHADTIRTRSTRDRRRPSRARRHQRRPRPLHRRRRRRSDHDRGDPPRPQLSCEPDQAGARPDVVLADRLRGARLRSDRLRPRLPPARPGAEPSGVHGNHGLLRPARRRAGRRRGALEPGDIVLINEPVRNRIAPPGRRRWSCRCTCRRRADRLHGDQGALARHRRHRSVLHEHDRRVPGGRRLPRSQAVRARPARQGHLPHGDREHASCRATSRAMSTPRWSACVPGPPPSYGSSSATVSSASRSASSGCTTTARRLSARTSSGSRTAATSPRARWTRTAISRRPRPLRGRGRGRRVDHPPRLHERAGRDARPGQLPRLPIDRLRLPGRR